MVNCGNCNSIMKVDDWFPPQRYHCPICHTKLIMVNGHPKWYDVDGNPFTPKPLEDRKIPKE